MCCFSTVLMCLSVLLCLQRAGPASTNLGWGTWSVQSVPLTASLIMRVRCTAAVRKTTSVPRETPPPWLAPVSIRATDAPCDPCLCVISRNFQMIQVPPWPGLTSHISDRRNPALRAESCGRIFLLIIPKNMHGNLVLSVLLRILDENYRCFRFHPRSLCVLANLITQNTVDGKYIKWKHCLSAAELWILRAGKKKKYIYMVWASMAV